MRFKDKNKNLVALSREIEHYLVSDGYDVQSNTTPSSMVIQAKKAGVPRDIITAIATQKSNTTSVWRGGVRRE